MSTHQRHEDGLQPPPWVNQAGETYHAGHQRLLKDLRSLSYEEATLEEPDGRTHRADAAMPNVSESTQALLEEDWTQRSGRLAALGPAIISLAVIFSLALICCAVVWFGAAWLEHLTGVL